MQYVLALLLAGLTAWLISAIGSGTIERAVSAFAQLVGGWRPDGWPRGVQEEDRDMPWGWLARMLNPPPAASIDDVPGGAPTTRLRPRTTPR